MQAFEAVVDRTLRLSIQCRQVLLVMPRTEHNDTYKEGFSAVPVLVTAHWHERQEERLDLRALPLEGDHNY